MLENFWRGKFFSKFLYLEIIESMIADLLKHCMSFALSAKIFLDMVDSD